MVAMTLCYLTEGDPLELILLAKQKRGGFIGKYNGIGGKVNHGENSYDAAIRELKEEIGVEPSINTNNEYAGLEYKGSVTFIYDTYPDSNTQVHLFFLSEWVNEPIETDETIPDWFDIDFIPYEVMPELDKHWFPFLLQGKRINGRFQWSGGTPDAEIIIRDLDTDRLLN